MPLAALAAGSMGPDLPYYLPWLVDLGAEGTLTHSLLGVLTLDLIFAAAMWGVWLALSPALRDLVPDVVRDRWSDGAPRGGGVLPVVSAFVVGSLTHVVWDAFTHVGRFGHTHVDALAATYPSPIGDLPGYRYLQYLSGALGLAVLLVAGLRQRSHRLDARRRPALARAFAWTLGAGAALANLLRYPALTEADAPRTVAFLAITASVSGAVLAALALCLVWFVGASRITGPGAAAERAATTDR